MSSPNQGLITDPISFKVTFPSREPLEFYAKAVRPGQSLAEAIQELIATQLYILVPQGQKITVEQIDELTVAGS